MIIQKLLLGVTLAAPIGPVSVEMIKRGLTAGFWAAFNIRLGGAVGNVLCLIVAFVGMSAIHSHTSVMHVLGLLGSALLLYMGVNTIRKGLKPIELSPISEPYSSSAKALGQSLVLGFMLAVFNPVAVVFWLTIFANDVPANQVLTFSHFLANTLIVVGVLLWGAFLSLLLAMGRKVVHPKTLKLITVLSGVVLLYFGIKYSILNSIDFYQYLLLM